MRLKSFTGQEFVKVNFSLLKEEILILQQHVIQKVILEEEILKKI